MKFRELREKTLTPAEKKKREEIAKAIEKDNPDMPMDKKMAIATATAKKVAEAKKLDELSPKTIDSYRNKRAMGTGGAKTQQDYQRKARAHRELGNDAEADRLSKKAKNVGLGKHRAIARHHAQHGRDVEMLKHKSVKRVPKGYYKKETVDERVKDGKLDPTSKMGKSKLTGQEVGQYYRQNPKAKQAARDPMVKKAIELALDTGGNMSYGEKEVEKLKRGLSRHPEVKKAFRYANESVNEGLLNEITLARKDFDKIKKGDKITVHFDSSMKKGHKQTLVVKSKTRSNKYNVDIINMTDANDSRNRTKFKFFSRGGKDATLAWGDMGVTLTKYVMEYGGPPISRKKYLRQMREAVSPAQQAAIAISKKERGEKPKNECADEDDFKPHMMYDPKTGKGYMAKKYADHVRMDKMGYTHEKPEVKEEKNCGCGQTPCKTYGVKEELSNMPDSVKNQISQLRNKKMDVPHGSPQMKAIQMKIDSLLQRYRKESVNEDYRKLAQKGMGTESEKDARVGLEMDFYDSKGNKQFGKITRKTRSGYTVKDEKGKVHSFAFLDRQKAKELLRK